MGIRSLPYKYIVAATFVLGVFMDILDTTIVNVAIPAISEDFEVGPGPKFHVYLVPRAAIRSSSDVKDQMFVDLGRLRSFKGSQRYAIPTGVEVSKYHSVIIWCEQFSVLISPADLKPRTS